MVVAPPTHLRPHTLVADISIKPLYKYPEIRDYTRIAIDNYYLVADKADQAGGGKDTRKVPIGILAQAIEANLQLQEKLAAIEARLLALENP